MIKTGKEWVISGLAKPGDVFIVERTCSSFLKGDELLLERDYRIKDSNGNRHYFSHLHHSTFLKKESTMTITLSGSYARRCEPHKKVRVLCVDVERTSYPVVYCLDGAIFCCSLNARAVNSANDLVPWIDADEEAFKKFLSTRTETTSECLREVFMAGRNSK